MTKQKSLSSPLLHRYWFATSSFAGFGVTAYSVEDAWRLLRNFGWFEDILVHIKEIVEDIDINELHFGHIRGNMGPPNFRGIWYPCMNLSGV